MKILILLFIAIAYAKQQHDIVKDVRRVPNDMDNESSNKLITTIKNAVGRSRGRIYLGGFVTPDSHVKYRYQVRLMSNNKNRNGEKMACGGSLINKSLILTAAHCVKDVYNDDSNVKLFEADYSQIYFGIINLDRISSKDPGTTSRIAYASDIIIHPKWKPENPETIYDIAIIKLQDPVIPDEISKFGFISLPNKEFCASELSKKIVSISGWGRTDRQGRTRILKAADIVVRKMDYCKKHFRGFDETNMICANTMEGAGTCSGDSGGPLAYTDPNTNEQILLGITSYGSQDCTDGKPSVFTNVCAYLDWIEEIMQK